MTAFPLLSVLLGAMATAVQGSTLKVWSSEEPNRPVSKVIAVLKDMYKTLEKEQKEDEEIYDKMACWCDSGDKEKTASIEDANTAIANLNSEIDALSATSEGLATEIASLEGDVEQYKASLANATEIRNAEHQEFVATELDLTESIQALKSAIVVLSKHQSTFLQEPATWRLSIVTMLTEQLRHHAPLLKGNLTPKQRRTIEAFVQAQADTRYDPLHPKPEYAEQSGEIYGILQEMLQLFKDNLAEAQATEAEQQKSYAELASVKESEIKSAEQDIDAKTLQKADADERKANAKQELADTEASLSADEQYLAMLKEKCEMTDQEWTERQNTRADEMAAVSGALQTLTTDDSHDLFTRTFNPSLLQTHAGRHSEQRARVASLLSAVGSQVRSPKLAALASRVKLDNFTDVKAAIDNMTAQLVQEKEDEVKHKDFCIGELNENELQTEEKEHEKERVLAEIDSLESTIEQLTKEINALNKSNADMELQLKQAAEDREMENKEFQTTVADQRETQTVIEQAKQYLLGYYAKETNASPTLVQKRAEPVGPPPPEGFAKYEDSASATGVISMIEKILTDAKQMEKDTIRAEEDAQKAYEDLVKSTNGSIEANSQGIVDKTDEKANAETSLVQEKGNRDTLVTELEGLSTYAAEVHVSCDFILKNFDVRQAARDQEIEALRQAKAILSGSMFGR